MLNRGLKKKDGAQRYRENELLYVCVRVPKKYSHAESIAIYSDGLIIAANATA